MNKHTISDLYQMQSLPLSAKIRMTQYRIREWVDCYGCRAAFYVTQRRRSRRKLKSPDWLRHLRECASEYGTLFSLPFFM